MSEPEDPAYLSLDKSFVFWTTQDIVQWLAAMEFDERVISDVQGKRMTGSQLISLVNSESLKDIKGLSSLKQQQLLWNLERRVARGDDLARNALKTSIFDASAGAPLPAAPSSSSSGSAKSVQKQTKRKKVTVNLIDLGEADDQLDDNEQDSDGDESDENDDAESDTDNAETAAVAASGSSTPMVFEVVFEREEPPNVLLEEFQPGNRLIVKSFPKKQSGEAGAAERSGKIKPGDFVTAVNSINLDGFPFQDAIRLLTERRRPLVLTFMRVPKHLMRHNLDQWSMHALRTVLHEQGLELTGMERHAELVAMAKRCYWDKALPLPPAASRASQAGAKSVMNGETTLSGWLLLKLPHERIAERRFCDLHGSELLYHRPSGPATEDGGEYEEAPAGSIDINDIALVDTTRTSESGNKDLRLVDKEGQVYMISASADDTLQLWHRRFLTAQIIGRGTTTSGLACPSAPFLVSRTHNSMTLSWLPPRQPYLNTVHSFQVQYKSGITPIAPWRTAADEVHSTTFHMKGLNEGERHVFRVRAMHDKDTTSVMRWGAWSDTSAPFVTEREQARSRRPPTHLWVLIHGLKSDSSDMAYMGNQLDARYGETSYVHLAEANAGPFKTLDGIDAGGNRLYEEVLQLLDRLPSVRKISLIGHGIGGLYARVVALRLDERAILTRRLEPANFALFGTPNLGTLTTTAGAVGALFTGKTNEQLRMRDVSQSGKPFLLRLCEKDAVAALARFPNRMLYANVRFDSTELQSAAILSADPFNGWSDKRLAETITPQYECVLQPLSTVQGEEPSAYTLPSARSTLGMHLESRQVDRDSFQQGLSNLMQIGWSRTYVYNPSGLNPYNDLVVASAVWLSRGSEIVRHFLDTAIK